VTTKLLLRSFAGGEITPELNGRIDLGKFQTGLGLARNFITLPHGPAARRPGTRFIIEAKDSTHKVRLIPFQFSADQTAVLEFGHQYIRFHIDGGTLLEGAVAIDSITGATVTATAHGFSTGDWVYIGARFHKITVTGAQHSSDSRMLSRSVCWLARLGFTIHPPEPYGCLGEMFHRFEMHADV